MKTKPNKSHKPKPPREKRQKHSAPIRDTLPPISVLAITGVNEEGELIAEPVKWDTARKPPYIIITESERQLVAAKGDRVLAKLKKTRPHFYQAKIIRILPQEQSQTVLGVFVPTAKGGIIEPISRKIKESFLVGPDDTDGALKGELVSGITLEGMSSLGMTCVKITERLGSINAPRAASLIASQMYALPSIFSQEALAEAQEATSPELGNGRTDLRTIPLVTIDGEDARDFDDTVFAQKDGDGWHLVVAIADVAYYVTEGSALDASAFERGNSVYFPDRVIPMLPERLSNGLCSLMPDEDRYCLAVHLWIDAQGQPKKYQFVRGLMRSQARLTYEQVEARHMHMLESKEPDDLIKNLYGAYAALANERDQRGALDLNLPEFKIRFDDAGNVADIVPRTRLESHRLIETFMIAANVAAADFLLKNRIPAIYRVHETPSEEKLEELGNLLQSSGYSLHTGAGIKAMHFNRVLKKAEGQPEEYLVNTSILRSQMQAYYSDENLGHFGLSLQKYCHFTSPIRRYADLIVHRALVAVIAGDKTTSANHLSSVALHISDTERRAMMAERDASDRYKVAFMSRRIGNVFAGVIVSLNEYGLFVALTDTGITGFIPVRNLSGDFFHYDKRHASFKGKRSNQTFHIGQSLIIRVQTANTMTSSLIFELAHDPVPSEPLRKPPISTFKSKPKKQKDRHRDRKNKGKRRRPTSETFT